MSSSHRRAVLRAATVLALAAGAAVSAATPALAHVTAQPPQAEQGGYTVINMRVPNESDTAGTVKLEITLPAEHPISGVRTTPVPGWTATMAKAPLATPIQRHGRTITEVVRTVTWTAAPGTRIGPGEFVEFPLSLGPLPEDTDRLVIPAVQTYDDGEVVAWNQTPVDGSEPERPAPVVELSPATGEVVETAAEGPAPDVTARWLGGAGLLLGALGLGVGLGAVLRGRGAGGGG
jgi:uncharacterized protein YcnI